MYRRSGSIALHERHSLATRENLPYFTEKSTDCPPSADKSMHIANSRYPEEERAPCYAKASPET